VDPHPRLAFGPACLGWIHAGTVRAEFMDSVLGLLAEDRDRAGRPLVTRYETASAGADLAAARNQVCARFLALGAEPWLWMVDTDIVFTPALLPRLLSTAHPHDRPLVTGLYWTTTAGGLPLVPMIYDHHPGATPAFTPCDGWEPEAVTTVGGCGAGCLLIHRRVLESVAAAEMGPEWFTEHDGDGRRYGEDLSFCLRAGWAGFTVTADTAARAGHVKPVIIGLDGLTPGSAR
jgi:hypothetical protein